MQTATRYTYKKIIMHVLLLECNNGAKYCNGLWFRQVASVQSQSRGSNRLLKHISCLDNPIVCLSMVRWKTNMKKKTKAAGPAGIPSEMLTALGEFGIKEITNLLILSMIQVKFQQTSKSQWKLQYPPKKQVHLNVNSTAQYVLWATSQTSRYECFRKNENKILPKMSESQFGFMADEGSRNDIFSLRTFMERAIKVQNDLYLCSIDYLRHLWKKNILICLTFYLDITVMEKILESSEACTGNMRRQ